MGSCVVVTPQRAGVSCNDDNPCALTSQCDGAGVCVAGTPTSARTLCNDDDQCTGGDQCNGAGTCIGTPVPNCE